MMKKGFRLDYKWIRRDEKLLEGNLLEVTKSRDLVVRSHFPLTLCFFDRFFFEFRNARFRGTDAERYSVFDFVLGPEVLRKETSCDLSDLVKADVSENPINPLRGVELGLVS
jgi:hypothetical protein